MKKISPILFKPYLLCNVVVARSKQTRSQLFSLCTYVYVGIDVYAIRKTASKLWRKIKGTKKKEERKQKNTIITDFYLLRT